MRPRRSHRCVVFARVLTIAMLLCGLLVGVGPALPARADAPAAEPSSNWNTFLGGTEIDWGRAIAVDDEGNVFVAGESYASWGEPLRPFAGGCDAFVAKLSADGDLVWNTFLGGSADDPGYALALDKDGYLYVAGPGWAEWGSPLNGFSGSTDVFLAKLSSDGTLIWNTFLGGSGTDSVGDIGLDGGGNVVIHGESREAWGDPKRVFGGGGVDAFVAKVNADGGLVWNTFLGGAGGEQCGGVALDGAGNAYVTGYSAEDWGDPVRTYATGDAFVAAVDSDGFLLWNTFLGGSGTDFGRDVAVDGDGNVFVAGDGDGGWGHEVQRYNDGGDVFVAKLAGDGGLVWTSFVGGDGGVLARAVVVDGTGNLLVAGESMASSWGRPVRPYNAEADGFLVRLGSGGDLAWNTLLGESAPDGVYAMAVDTNATAWVTGVSVGTWGNPVRMSARYADAFVAEMFPASLSLPVTIRDDWGPQVVVD